MLTGFEKPVFNVHDFMVQRCPLLGFSTAR